MTILSWYGIEETLEDTEALLDETLLEEWDLPLTSSKLSTLLTSISIAEGKGFICSVDDVKAEERNCLFPKSLLGATMQDGSIR